MKKNLFLMFGLGAVLLTSCDQDITNEIYLPGGGGSVVVTDSTSTKQLQVFTNLEMLQPAVSTRAVDNQWELNDMIGISSTGMINNMKFTRNGSTNQFVSASKVFFTDTDTHTFNAYYPYMASPTNDIIEFQVPEAAVQSEQKVNDFLFANGTASYASPSLTLNFTHQMVRVIIKVYTSPEYGFTTNDFAGSLLTFIGYFDSGTFNIKTGKVECSDESVTTYYFGDPQSDHMEYTLYVPAQVMPDMTLQLSNGENFVFLTNDTWKAGHSYSYSLKPVRNTLEVISATISPWTVESEKTINGYEENLKEDWRVSTVASFILLYSIIKHHRKVNGRKQRVTGFLQDIQGGDICLHPDGVLRLRIRAPAVGLPGRSGDGHPWAHQAADDIP